MGRGLQPASAQQGFTPQRLRLSRSEGGCCERSGKLPVPPAVINTVINRCEWFYSKFFLHRTLIRRHLSLFSPPSSSLSEDYSFGLIAPGAGIADSRQRCRSPRPGKRDRCSFWTSLLVPESSLSHGAEAAGAARGIPAMSQQGLELCLQL